MSLIHPPRLNKGDRVALISPSGPVPTPESVDECAAELQRQGYEVWVGNAAKNKLDYVAGTPAERVADLNHALRDPDIRGIFCTRGGYGAIHLVRELDYEAFKNDPKVFAGFSDITALHGSFLSHSAVTTLHAATFASAFITEGQKLVPEARDAYFKLITTAEPLGSVREAMNWKEPWTLQGGKARGRLIGGNLAVFASLIGTSFCPAPDGGILFLEDVGEEGYKIDRMLMQLITSGYLDRVEGIVLGQFTNSDPSVEGRDKVDTVIPRVLEEVNKPILANFPIGHVPINVPLPIGLEAELDADGGDLIVTEAFAK